MGTSVKAVSALPSFTILPAKGDYTVGSVITVTIGAQSDSKKVSGLDSIVNYDATKLTAGDPKLLVDKDFVMYVNKVADGKLSITLIKSAPGDNLSATAVGGALYEIPFTAKAAGTAQVDFLKTCTQDSMGDANILTTEGGAVVDIISCLDNDKQMGIYTIKPGTGGDTPTNTPAPSNTTINNNTTNNYTTAITQTPKKTELPKTGNTAVTMGLFLLGGVGLIGGFLLKAL